MQTHPAFPIFTYVASVNRPSLTSASNQSFRSPAKEPENCISGSMLCCSSDSESAFTILGSASMLEEMFVRAGYSCNIARGIPVESCTGRDLPPSCHFQYLPPRKPSMKYQRGSRSLPPDQRPNQWEVVPLPTRATA